VLGYEDWTGAVVDINEDGFQWKKKGGKVTNADSDTLERFEVIVVEHKGKYEEYSPKEISCMILNNLKESAEAFLATEVVDAVIIVLAYFSDKQRHAIKDAGTLAALNVMRLISKPTTANCIRSRKEC
ncbi:heat shock cognate 70 kDa protein-like protein, partial [Tanacetum coccineum]